MRQAGAESILSECDVTPDMVSAGMSELDSFNPDPEKVQAPNGPVVWRWPEK